MEQGEQRIRIGGRCGFLAAWAACALALAAAGQTQPPALDPGKKIRQLVHDVWRVEDGLPSNLVWAITQTRDGYLWVATKGGLARFDGARFEVFDRRTVPAFEIDNVNALVEGPDGSLWIGSRGSGLYRYRGGEFSHYQADNPAGNFIRALSIDGRGELWIGTRGGLYRLEQGRLVAWQEVVSLVAAEVTALHRDAEGSLWIGTADRGVFGVRAGQTDHDLRQLSAADGLVSDMVFAIHRDFTGALWVATEHGLDRWRVDGRPAIRIGHYSEAEGLAGASVRALLEDRAGALWIATDSGLSRFYGDRLESVELRVLEVDNRLRALYQDRQGSLWLGSVSGGLERLKDGPITTFTPEDGLSDFYGRTVYQDRSGRLWVGTYNAGLNVSDDVEAPVWRPVAGFPARRVWSILEDAAGTLWAGTSDGLVRAGGRPEDSAADFRLYNTADGLASDRVRVVYEDPAAPGTLWLGTIGGGVDRWSAGASGDHAVSAHYDMAEGLSNNVVSWIHRDTRGDLWIGTEVGLNRLRGGGAGEIEVFTTGGGLSGDAMRSVHEDAGGDLWIGTRAGGLMRYRAAEQTSAAGAFTAYTSRDGLFDNDVWAILEDDRRRLWLSSDQGITRVDKRSFDAYDRGQAGAVDARHYGVADGMKTAECNSGGNPPGIKAADGTLWFPNMAGVVRVDPNARRASSPPPVVVEAMFAGGAAIDLGTEARLPPGSGDLELRYTGLSLRDAEDTRFRYRLEGYDRDWVAAGRRRVAFYTNLPPGSYRFEVLARHLDGEWSEAAAYAFSLAPPFHQTLWFRALAATGLGLVLVWAISRSRVRMRVGGRQLEERVAAHAAEVERLHRELERLQSPLITIRNFLGFVRQDAAAGHMERLEKDLSRVDGAAEAIERQLAEVSRRGAGEVPSDTDSRNGT